MEYRECRKRILTRCAVNTGEPEIDIHGCYLLANINFVSYKQLQYNIPVRGGIPVILFFFDNVSCILPRLVLPMWI